MVRRPTTTALSLLLAALVALPMAAAGDMARLDRPATQADLDAGRAVFTLGRAHATRVAALPAYPTPVAWVQPDRATVLGLAWQAEERLERGGWRRYIGLLSDAGPAMAPAEQIEYPAPLSEGWTSLAGGLDARLDGPSPDQPTSVSLWLRNRRAVPLRTHEVWLRPTAEGLAALRRGLTLTVTGEPTNPPNPLLDTAQGFPDEGRLRDLSPGQTLNAGRLDLRRVFGELAPGRYTLVLDLSGLSTAAAGQECVWTTLPLDAQPGGQDP